MSRPPSALVAAFGVGLLALLLEANTRLALNRARVDALHRVQAVNSTLFGEAPGCGCCG